MSRTRKDKPTKFRDDVNSYSGSYQGLYDSRYWEMCRENVHKKFHSRPKLRKTKDYESHWMSTPSWWTRLYMTRPQRKRQNQYLKQYDLIVLDDLDLLEESDIAFTGLKPHVYFW
jgi:hypothetical protein